MLLFHLHQPFLPYNQGACLLSKQCIAYRRAEIDERHLRRSMIRLKTKVMPKALFLKYWIPSGIMFATLFWEENMRNQSKVKKPAWLHRRFLWMVAGSSCMLSFAFLTATGENSRLLGYGFKTSDTMTVYLIVLLVFAVSLPLLKKPVIRKWISTANVIIVVLWICVVLFSPSIRIGSETVSIGASVIGAIAHCMLLVQWNLHFTLNKVENAGLIIWVSALLGVAMQLGFLVADTSVSRFFILILPLLSGIACLVLDITESLDPASPNSIERTRKYDSIHFCSTENLKAIRLRFFSSRIGLGLLYGAASGFIMNAGGEIHGNSLLAYVLAVLLVVTVLATLRMKQNLSLPIYFQCALPIIIVSIHFIVFFNSGITHLARIATGSAWMIGYIFFYTQLPTYREMTHMDITSFACLEKIATMIPWAISTLAVSFAKSSFSYLTDHAAAIDTGIVCYMFLMVLVYTALVMRHTIKYYPNQEQPRLKEDQDDLPVKVAKVANRYSLTKREAEVLSYLAKGYSRPYIEKKLYISKGTAKTHIYRIFTKIGVSS